MGVTCTHNQSGMQCSGKPGPRARSPPPTGADPNSGSNSSQTLARRLAAGLAQEKGQSSWVCPAAPLGARSIPLPRRSARSLSCPPGKRHYVTVVRIGCSIESGNLDEPESTGSPRHFVTNHHTPRRFLIRRFLIDPERRLVACTDTQHADHRRCRHAPRSDNDALQNSPGTPTREDSRHTTALPARQSPRRSTTI